MSNLTVVLANRVSREFSVCRKLEMHNVSVYQDFKQEVMCFSLTFHSFISGSIVEKVIIWHFIKRQSSLSVGQTAPAS